MNDASKRHPHEPEIPAVWDEEGRCHICVLLVRLDDLVAERDALRAENERLRREAIRYVVNRDVQDGMLGEWITVELTCLAGDGPHRPPHDTWAVRKSIGRCLNAEGEWEHEPQPSSRDDEFFARTRWPLEEALERAREALGDRGSGQA